MMFSRPKKMENTEKTETIRGADVGKWRELNCDFPVVTGPYLCYFR